VRVEGGMSPDSRELWLTWREVGGPPVEAPGRQGFGTLLLTHGHGGRVEMDWRRDGLVCSIRLTAARLCPTV
jgi:two-component system CheB/CheR fusion protein